MLLGHHMLLEGTPHNVTPGIALGKSHICEKPLLYVGTSGDEKFLVVVTSSPLQYHPLRADHTVLVTP